MNQDTLPLPATGVLICTLQKNWWVFVLRGALALIIAVIAFVMPADSLLALTLVFGAYSFVDGAFEPAHSVPGHTPYTATSTSCSHSSPCTISRNQKISHASSGCVSQYPAKMSAE